MKQKVFHIVATGENAKDEVIGAAPTAMSADQLLQTLIKTRPDAHVVEAEGEHDAAWTNDKVKAEVLEGDVQEALKPAVRS